MAAGILPLPQVPADEATISTLGLPKNLMAYYTALAVTGEAAAIRVLNLPPRTEEADITEALVREQVGLAAEFRIAYSVIVPPRGKSECKLLVVGLPEAEALGVLRFVAVGAPAPCALEVAGLAVLNGFLQGPGVQHAQEAVGVIETGAHVTFMALFNKGILVLVRKFDFGSETLVGKVQQQLGVDQQTAQGIVSDGSFDISQPVHEVMDPFLRQLSISKDFVERRENCRMDRLYVSGGTSLSRYWMDEVVNATGIEIVRWNPFDGLVVAQGAYPAELEGQQTRFAAAVGACLGAIGQEA